MSVSSCVMISLLTCWHCMAADLLCQGALLGIQSAARQEGAGVHGQVLARCARSAGELLGGDGRGAQEAHDRAQDAVGSIRWDIV